MKDAVRELEQQLAARSIVELEEGLRLARIYVAFLAAYLAHRKAQ